MRSTPFLTGWSVSPKRGLFDGLGADAAPAQAVTLPHDAMIGYERSADAPSGEHSGYFPGGAVQYTRTLEVDASEADLVHTLVFDGVYRDAMVYVNDEFAAQRPNGYARFAVRLDPFLRFDAPNTIRVESRAHRDSRWYSGLGIHRGVSLLTGPPVHVALDGIRVSTPDVDDAGALVQVETTVVNDSLRTLTLVAVVTLRGPDGSVVGGGRTPITLLAGESGVARERLWVASPERWSLESPALYRAELTLDAGDDGDTDAATFGIRSLQLDPHHGLRINGETVKLRGACIHHDNGILGARAIGYAEERRIRILKDAGFNAIRSAHNPLSPETLAACDRIGMLVMDESFDMWAESKSPFDYALSFPEWWERDIESMVAKDFNHPSVVFYSLGNEIPETGRPHGSRLGRLLADKVRVLDPTRFTTNSINGLVSVIKELPPMGGADAAPNDINDAMAADPGEMMTAIVGSDLVTQRTEESFAAVDAAGLNYGDSRYVSDAAAFPNRIIIGTETFATRLDRAWPLILENDHVIGEFTWTGWDYLGEAGIGRVDYTETGGAFAGTSGPFPWQLAWCGDIDITGSRRPASYFREVVYGLRDRPYIAVRRPRTDGLKPASGPWSWSDSIASWSWTVAPGTPVTVEVYSDAERVDLLLNGAVVGSAGAGRDNGYRAIFEVPFTPGELVAVAVADGVESGRDVLRSASGDIELRLSAERAQIRAAFDDLAFLTITLTDADGVEWQGDDREVEVTADGPGELIGLGSSDPRTTLSYLGSRTRTFDGRAQAIVRPTGPGDITVTASAQGLGSRTVVVRAVRG
ncbi:glycoside hydrolase family 2 TIM barrel-domain containing protein [Microbacterium rhizomatis]|uniref:Glycoside hydrolase family 2 protein n=1 Tax=Microbacterium rhizomatis TaxID=1631477 RepID=A0A5J5J4E7_9MICO|nr:glycoside hydrolase family 2 TIM barrel-domain containing protein [Microbacterium rhizomatis]KAA9110880.1 glycoside hydrolase family 2 protein [Microbacterium rhizomatis]